MREKKTKQPESSGESHHGRGRGWRKWGRGEKEEGVE